MAIDLTFNGYSLLGVKDWNQSGGSRAEEIVSPKQAGGYTDPSPEYATKTISVSGLFVKATADAAQTELDLMLAALNAGVGTLILYTGRYITAVKKSFEHSYILGSMGRAIEYQITFMATDPFWYASLGGSSNIHMTSTTQAATVTTIGNAKTPFIATVRASASGLTRVRISNTTASIQKWIEFNGTIAANKYLVLNSSLYTATNDGANCLSNVTGSFFDLVAGANTLTIIVAPAVTTDDIEIAYIDRWF